MNKKILLLPLLALLLTNCTRVAPDQGEQGVMVAKPWFFGHGGVYAEPVTTGVSYAAWSTSVVYVNMQPQLFNMQFDNVMSKDGVALHFHIMTTLRITNASIIVEKFGYSDDRDKKTAWYDTNIAPHLQLLLREAAKQYGMNELAISGEAASHVEAYVREQLVAYLKEKRLPVEVVDINAGKADPPDAVRDQRIATAAAQQRAITEVQVKIAEEARKGAEEARAEADRAYTDKMGLDRQNFIELRRIDMMKEVCGKGTCIFTSGGATPLINVRK